jgi:hypothetical protein
MKKIDYKKEYKDLYLPKLEPMLIDVPEMIFLMTDGKGDPNTSEEFQNAMGVLYGLSYTIKMSKMNNTQPKGYFEYVVPPLEGLWWHEDEKVFDGTQISDKSKFLWTIMIRQPEFVTKEVFLWAKDILSKKKPELDLSKARYELFKEGKCAQVMHIGSYDNEFETIKKLEHFIKELGYANDISETRKHHEIYLSDPRKTAPEKLKTVIRHPVKS